MFGWWIVCGWAGQSLAEAEWSRDVDVLLAMSVGEDELVAYATALGRQRDARALPLLQRLSTVQDEALGVAVAEALGRTPGGAEALRALAASRGGPVGAAALRGLGRQGDAGDVPGLIAALPGPQAVSAAEALGLLGMRGIPEAGASVAPLVAALDPLRPGVTHAAAFALYRLRPGRLAAPLQAHLRRVWEASTDDEARAWLVPTVLAGLEGAERRAFVVSVLDGPWRQTRQALIPALEPRDLGAEAWRALRVHPDPWVRSRAADRLGAEGVGDDVARRARVLAGEGGAAERIATLDEALTSPSPRVRSAAAGAVLAAASAAEAERLAASDDSAVRELVAEWAAANPAVAAVVLTRLVAAGGPASTWVAVTAALQAQPSVPAALRGPVERIASEGAFGARQAAARLAGAWGYVSQGTAARPGPDDLERDLATLRRIRGVEVDTTQGRVVVELDPASAPLAVSAFTWLAEHDRLDGLDFHRVVPGFVVQSGDPRGDGMGGPEWLLPDEPSGVPFGAGSVGIARSGYDTGGSQWFITCSDQPHLGGEYTRIGQVVRGLEIVRSLSADDRVLDVRVLRAPP